jgi:hypothetical protein
MRKIKNFVKPNAGLLLPELVKKAFLQNIEDFIGNRLKAKGRANSAIPRRLMAG